MTDATRILEPQRTRPEAAPASGPVHLSWDSELFVLRGDDREDLRRRVKALGDFLEHHPEVVLKDLAATLNTELPAQGSRLALVAGTVAELRTRLTRAGERLADPRCRQIRDAVGIYFFEQPLHPEGRLAFLFPGEGAQYLNMLGDLSIHFAEVRNLVEDCDEAARRAGHENHALSRAIFLPPDATPEEQAQAETELRSLGNAMLSVLMADWALYQCLLKLGLRPDAMAGHSMGELAALWAGGALATDSVMLGELAATIESVQQQEEQGGAEAVLLAVGAGRATVAEVVGQAASSQVYLAMDNCPHQTVVVGPPGPMARIEGEFQARKVYCERLPFRRPYHTPLFEPLLGPVQQMFAGAVFQPPQTPVYSCTTSRPFPADPDEIRRLTVAHWASPVEFTRMIEAMYADGVRLFVEAGPRGNLTSFVEDILRGQPCAALAANVQRRSGVTQFNHLAGQLAAHHVPLRLEYFYQRRNPQRVAWETSPTLTMNAEPPRNPSPPVHNARGIVLAQYLNTMEQFLDLQREVTECYLAGRRRVPAAHHPNRLSSPGINGSDSLPPASSSRPRAWPLMGEVFRHEAGQELIMRRKLDLREDLYAAHHTLGGRNASNVDPDQHGQPVVPMTFSLEMMAEAASVLLPGKVVVALQNIRLLRWLPFDDEEPTTVEVTVRVVPDESHGTRRQVSATIRDMGNSLRPGNSKWIAVEATILLDDHYPAPPPVAAFPLTREVPCPITPEVLYRNLFHGPLFQGVCSTGRIGDEGIEGQVRVLAREKVFRSFPNPDLVLDPVLVDAAMHLLGCWHLYQPDQAGRILLPYEVKAIELYGPCPPVGAVVTSRGRTDQSSARHFKHGLEVMGPDGRPWCRLHSAGYWRFYTPFGDVNFHGPKDQYFLSRDWALAVGSPPHPQPLSPEAGARGENPGLSQACCMRLEPPQDLLEPVMRAATGRVTLSRSEFTHFRHLPGPEAQINQWLFGRIAAKDAVRTLWRQRHGERLFPADIEIDIDDQGHSRARRRASSEPDGFPAIAMVASEHFMAALATFSPYAGMAVEHLQEQEAGFEEAALDAEERRLLDLYGPARAEGITRFCCAREALAQALGKKQVEDARRLTVRKVDLDKGTLGLALSPDLAAQFPDLASSLVLVHTARDQDVIVATTLGEKEPV